MPIPAAWMPALLTLPAAGGAVALVAAAVTAALAVALGLARGCLDLALLVVSAACRRGPSFDGTKATATPRAALSDASR